MSRLENGKDAIEAGVVESWSPHSAVFNCFGPPNAPSCPLNKGP